MNPPPSAPLPTIPIPKIRSGANYSPGTSSPATPSSGLPTRTPSSSSILSTPSSAPNTPLPNQNLVTGPSQPLPALPSGKGLKKTASYNVFPRPATGGAPQSAQQNAHTTTTPQTSKRSSSLYSPPISRSMSTRSSLGQPLMSASSLPATPIVPNNFPEGSSYVDRDEPRGRPASTAGAKDKGNVVISVRVRPEVNQNDDSTAAAAATAGEWMVDGRQSLVSYKGREGGEYIYGTVTSEAHVSA